MSPKLTNTLVLMFRFKWITLYNVKSKRDKAVPGAKEVISWRRMGKWRYASTFLTVTS